jgi:hypothetical protein
MQARAIGGVYMKEQDIVRLKRTVTWGGHSHPVGTSATIKSADFAAPTPTFEVAVSTAEGAGSTLMKLTQDDLFLAGDVEISQTTPINLVSIRPLERMNKDVRVEVHAICTNQNGSTYVSTSKTWLLFADILNFIEELARVQAKDINKTELSSATHGELAISLWQRHGLPVVNVSIGSQRQIQNQAHQDELSFAFELNTPLQDVIDGFRKLAFETVKA